MQGSFEHFLHRHPARNIVAGIRGERVATRFLRDLGYSILARNVRLGKDEIDIVAVDPRDQVIVFAEVKSRASESVYDPSLNITPLKRRNMMRAARQWVNRRSYNGGYRLDVLCVMGERVTDHLIEINGG